MKALLFSCACILGTSFWGVSQNIEIKLDGMGADLSGSSYDVNVTEATLAQNGGIFTAHFVVTNNTENNGKWQIMRKNQAAFNFILADKDLGQEIVISLC